jgi:hypothetical protein
LPGDAQIDDGVRRILSGSLLGLSLASPAAGGPRLQKSAMTTPLTEGTLQGNAHGIVGTYEQDVHESMPGSVNLNEALIEASTVD